MTDRHILVTNDDGIESDGIWHLAEAMSGFGKVMVVAPAGEASGSGTMVTYRRELQIEQVESRLPGIKAYSVDGTPADCVLVGLRRLKEGWISVVAAGINPGANLGVDFFLSGTCGAALIGAFRHVTSFALSLDLELTPDGPAPPEWSSAIAVAKLVGRGIDQGTVPDSSFLNINVPPLPLDEIHGISITRVAPGGYVHLVEKGDGVHESIERQLVRDDRHAHPGTDIRAVIDGYVSISPLDTSLSHKEHHESLSTYAEDLTLALRD
jgi:5'-nucleotidase